MMPVIDNYLSCRVSSSRNGLPQTHKRTASDKEDEDRHKVCIIKKMYPPLLIEFSFLCFSLLYLSTFLRYAILENKWSILDLKYPRFKTFFKVASQIHQIVKIKWKRQIKMNTFQLKTMHSSY